MNCFQSGITLTSFTSEIFAVKTDLDRRFRSVISIKDIDDNGCKLKARDLIFYKFKCHLTKGSNPFCTYWLQQSHASVCIIETSCSSWCTRSALLALRIVPSSWNNDVGTGQMIHWFQSIEGLLLLALDGRSLSGPPNCAIFRKTLKIVPTNDFLTTCKH